MEARDMRLIKAQEKDVSIIVDIIKQCSDLMIKQGMDYWSNAWKFERIKAMVSDSSVFLIYLNGKIIGTITYSNKHHSYYDGSEKKFWNENTNNVVYISRFAVLPEYQNNGVGSEIIKIIEDQLTDYKYVRLDIHPSNKRLVNFYVKNGYSLVGENSVGIYFEKKLKN